MRKRYVYLLKDCKGNIIIEGKKKDVENKVYQRYVYGHIFTDELYRKEIKIFFYKKIKKSIDK